MVPLSIARAATELGYRFLGYIAAAEPEVVERFVERGEGLTHRQREAVLAAVDELAEVLDINGLDPSDRRSMGYWVELAMGQTTDAGVSFPNALRLHSGGDLPDPPAADPMTMLLLQYAREAYPYYLLPGGMQEGRVGASRIALRLPAAQAFQKRVLEHRLVRGKYQSHEDLPSTRISLPTEGGPGGTILLYRLLVELTNHTWMQCQAAGDTGLPRFLEETQSGLSVFFRLMSGETVPSQTFYGIHNVDVEGDEPIPTPWGLLRAVDEYSIVTPSFGPIEHWTAPPTAVLFSSFSEEDLGADGGDEKSVEQLERHGMLLRLSLALSEMEYGRQPVTGAFAWWYVQQPLRSWIAGDSGPASERRSVVCLTADMRAQFSAVCAAVAETHPKHLDLAAARLVGAAGERHDAADALIDAVIAWENILGSRQGEITTRVSAAMALLLENAFDQRIKLAKEIRDIYNLRSRILHGELKSRGEEVTEASKTAILLGFKALKAVHDNPRLRELRKSRERSDFLLLSGSLPTGPP